MKEKINVRVTEVVSYFTDHWNYSSECHYTEDHEEEVQNDYTLELTITEEGEIVESREEIEQRLIEIIDGVLVDFEVI